jgi:hypothetical protein
MTLQEVRVKLDDKNMSKYIPYLQSFFNLTEDERINVLNKNEKFKEFYELLSLEMKLIVDNLMEALSMGSSGYSGNAGSALQVEDLDTTLRLVTYEA